VAAECAEDLAADGVVYAEVRFAPELHVAGGLSLDEVVEAVLEGFRAGSEGRRITVYALLTAMRTAARSLEIAELAVRYRDRGVVGFDIAGAEAGSPPSRHLDAFQYVARENFHITIHAGEGFGLPSIWEALQWCGAERLGHGVRIMDDIHITPEGMATLGRLASYVRDRRIPLSGHVLLVSGRASFELTQKASMAGIPILAAVSAPSTLAVELADEVGLTVVGFLRGTTMNVYSRPDRIA